MSSVKKLERISAEFDSRVDRILETQEIARKVVALRTKLGLSQAQFARLTRLSQPYLSKLEGGRISNVELKTLMSIAVATGYELTVHFE